jgi:Ca-activated chloride channel family protein
MRPLLAASLIAVQVMLTGQNQPVGRFRSNADAVRVDVQVRRGGRPVAGLTAADFELRDTSVVQQIEAVAIEDVPVTLFLALDTSSSVKGDMLQRLKAAARAALGALRADDSAALLTFSQQIDRPAKPTSDRNAVTAAIDRMAAEGSTALRDAIFAATALREYAPGRVILLVFTDGLDTASWLDTPAVIEAALRSDMVVYGVTTQPPPKDYEMDMYRDDPDLYRSPFIADLTERTGGELIQVKSGADLAGTFVKIVADFKSRYLLTYSPKNVPAGGWHPIEVKLKNRRGDVTARRGYWR